MRAAIAAGLRPDPILTVSQWADKYRMLNSASAAEPGPYRTGRTPFLRMIMDDLSEYSLVEEVIVCKGAQLGVTEAGLNWVGYTIDISPCPILLVEPTLDLIKYVSKNRVQKMIDDSPTLAKKIPPRRQRDSNNTIFEKEFPGGVFSMVGANSAVGLRSKPIKRLMLDEIDAYPDDLDGEGNPLDLARKRTATFAKRKIFILSTPLIKDISPIEKLFEETDQRYFFLPCPECGVMQHLVWENLHYVFDKKRRLATDVYYECCHCGEHIDERWKTQMLNAGEWTATAPENHNPKRAGYHINSMYSPLGWYSWGQMAVDWENAQGDELAIKTFTNVNLGKAYELAGEKPEWKLIYDRRMDYEVNKIPAKEVVFLTAGADVQEDRIEVEIVGWCADKSSYSVDYRVLPGKTSSEDSPVWGMLEALLNETWDKPGGGTVRLLKMCVDSGYNSTEVYAFCDRHPIAEPTKGNDALITFLGASKPVKITRKGKPIGSTKVWHLGVSILKAELYGWLNLADEGKGYCYFPKYAEEYFKGLTAEELVTTKNQKGQDVKTWIKKYKRNEPLDCRIYARAAAHMAGMDTFTPEQWAAMSAEGGGQGKPKTKRKSDYWDK